MDRQRPFVGLGERARLRGRRRGPAFGQFHEGHARECVGRLQIWMEQAFYCRMTAVLHLLRDQRKAVALEQATVGNASRLGQQFVAT